MELLATVEVKEWMNNVTLLFTGGCDYLSMLRIKVIHASKSGPRCKTNPAYGFLMYHRVFQMKPEHRKIVLKAMPHIIKHLDVNVSFLSQFESKNILDEHSIEDIKVGEMSKLLQVVINSGFHDLKFQHCIGMVSFDV